MRIFHRKNPRADYLLSLSVLILSVVGVIMISSASVVISYEKYGTNFYFAFRQLVSLGVGILAMIIISQIDYRVWRKFSFWALLVNIILLVAVFIPGIGVSSGGAQRWVHFGFISFQPSEIAKLTLILYLAAWLEKKGEGIKDFYSGTIPFLFLNLVVLGLIILQPDMGTMVIVAMTAFIIFYLAGSKRIHLAGIGVSALIVIWILIKSAPYRMRRLLVFLKPEQVEGSAYHINQILIAIGSGGLLGLGFGQSRQKYLYLPQVHTDSIFAIIVEELGFLRAALILGVFVFFAWRGYRIARQAPDVFARLVATGITSWIIVQAFINIAAMLGIVPLTGVPLPFISFGGSSLVMCLAAIGILLNISKQSVE